MSGRILLIDDEPDFARLVGGVLTAEGFAVATAGDGPPGLTAAVEGRPDVILLDWNLPTLDGLEVCRRLKADPRTQRVPVILLTARGRETDVVLALEMGAEDFITKRALRPRELVARVRAALRRVAPAGPAEPVLTSGDLSLDLANRRVSVKGATADLRAKEFDMLRVFLQNRNRVLTRRFLSEAVWGADYIATSRAIDTTMARLRGKLGPEAEKIQAIIGVGYRFEEEV
jgi:DNA-binding response OmpR family regulator